MWSLGWATILSNYSRSEQLVTQQLAIAKSWPASTFGTPLRPLLLLQHREGLEIPKLEDTPTTLG